MRKIIKAYQYLFYKNYRFFESMSYPWWSEYKAATSNGMIFFFIISPFINYYEIFIDKYSELISTKAEVVTLASLIIIFNHYAFIHKDKWKSIVAEFDKLPKKKNRMGSGLVILFICLVAANFIYSFYLYGQVDWSQYR